MISDSCDASSMMVKRIKQHKNEGVVDYKEGLVPVIACTPNSKYFIYMLRLIILQVV